MGDEDSAPRGRRSLLGQAGPGEGALSKYAWLSSEWFAETFKMSATQPERPGATARIQYVIEGGPSGAIKYYWLVENGKLTESKLGEIDDAEITLTQSYDDAMKIQKLQLDANAAFMQGRLKVDGNIGKLMSLLPVTSSAEYRQLQKEILEVTDFGD